MNAIMTVPLRRSLPHRFVVGVAVVTLAAASLLNAQEKQGHYALRLAVSRASNAGFIFDVAVVDRATGETVAHPHVEAGAGVPASITTDGTPRFNIRLRGEADGTATADLQVYDVAGSLLETSAAKYTPKSSSSPAAQPISVEFKDADLRDIIHTFGELTNLETKVDADVNGKVTVELHEVPWDQALQRILFDNGCEYEVAGSTLNVRRIR
jgi:hypothetical protein